MNREQRRAAIAKKYKLPKGGKLPRRPRKLDEAANAAIDGAASGSHEAEQQRLDSGMRVGEAINRACMWWENKARKIIRETRTPGNKGAGFFTLDPQDEKGLENSLPSGIMRALPWSDLTREEQLQVTKVWHHQFVRVPNVDPELYLKALEHPGYCFYCGGVRKVSAFLEQLPGAKEREMCVDHFKDRYPVEYAKWESGLTVGGNDG